MPYTILDELKRAFKIYGIKAVARNDKAKGAYYPNEEQRAVMSEVGILPVASNRERLIPIRVMGADDVLYTTYYNADRATPGRPPEPRMGRGLVNWVEIGDELMLGTDGVTIFARKLSSIDRLVKPPEEIEAVVESVYNELDTKQLLDRANQGIASPPQMTVTTKVFVRNPAVKAFVIRRCEGKCEVPNCTYAGFEKDNGMLFIEVHHVTPLGEGGNDTILNTAGICPNHHKYAHFGPDRAKFAAALSAAVRKATEAFEAAL